MKTRSYVLSTICFLALLLLQGLFLKALGSTDHNNSLSPAPNWRDEVLRLKELGVKADIYDLEISGKQRHVVVLGERHIKDSDLKALETELIDLIPLRLIEDYAFTDPQSAGWSDAIDRIIIPTAVFIEKAYLHLSFKTPSSSALFYSERQGFKVRIDGSVIYNNCFLGRVNSQGFYYDQKNIERFVSASQNLNHALFFQNLSTFTLSTQKMRKQIDADNLAQYPQKEICEPLKVDANPNTISVSMGFGDLSIWSDKKTYGLDQAPSEQLMVRSSEGINWNPKHHELRYPKEGEKLITTLVPSKRDLRMVDSIFAALRAFEDVGTVLVIVGDRHRRVFRDLIPSWKKRRAFFLNQD